MRHVHSQYRERTIPITTNSTPNDNENVGGSDASSSFRTNVIGDVNGTRHDLFSSSSSSSSSTLLSSAFHTILWGVSTGVGYYAATRVVRKLRSTDVLQRTVNSIMQKLSAWRRHKKHWPWFRIVLFWMPLVFTAGSHTSHGHGVGDGGRCIWGNGWWIPISFLLLLDATEHDDDNDGNDVRDHENGNDAKQGGGVTHDETDDYRTNNRSLGAATSSRALPSNEPLSTDNARPTASSARGNVIRTVLGWNTNKDNGYNEDNTNKKSFVPKATNITATPEDTEEKRGRSDSVNTQNSTLSSSSITKEGGSSGVKYLEMIVHNVSHTDLVLSLGKVRPPGKAAATTTTTTEEGYTTDDEDDEDLMLCRPRFSAFDMFSRRVLHALRLHYHSTTTASTSSSSSSAEEGGGVRSNTELLTSIISYPRYERNVHSPRYSIVMPRRMSRRSMLPVGFHLSSLDSDEEEKGGKASQNSKGKGEKEGQVGDESLMVLPNELRDLRMRGRDVRKIEPWCGKDGGPATEDERQRGDLSNEDREVEVVSPAGGQGLTLNAVFFPLLATLLPRWHAQIGEKYYSDPRGRTQSSQNQQQKRKIKKVVILVSGVGTPRNWTHSISGNSTQACAELMEIFIKVLYPDVTVVRIHSETNIFRYDENLTFAERELMPCIDAYRDSHARNEPYPDELPNDESGGNGWTAAAAAALAGREGGGGRMSTTVNNGKERNPFNPDWKQTFSVTLSFADGSPARTHAVQASLRPYRPTYFHLWQLKTFWHESKICDDDIEVHSFEDMETVPAIEAGITTGHVRMVVEEMKKFRNYFLETVQENRRNDIRKFWLRKTKKPVLAVLLVERPGEGMILYRGSNMEVSMPTGSLCAERNVIGTALASDPALKREDLRMVAVLAVPLPDEDLGSSRSSLPPLPPPVADSTVCALVGSSTAENVPAAVASTDEKSISSEVEEKLAKYQRPENIRKSISVASFSSLVECIGEDEENDNREEVEGETMLSSWVMETASGSGSEWLHQKEKSSACGGQGVQGTVITVSSSPKAVSFPGEGGTLPSLNLGQASSAQMIALTPPGTPVRKIKLYSRSDADIDTGNKMPPADIGSAGEGGRGNGRPVMGGGLRKQKRFVVVHSPKDINPLRPCGACNEWLKKIAESNPYFKVVTFTDADCNGVYVSPCQE